MAFKWCSLIPRYCKMKNDSPHPPAWAGMLGRNDRSPTLRVPAKAGSARSQADQITQFVKPRRTNTTGLTAISDTGARCLTSAYAIARWFASCRGERPLRPGLQLGPSHLRALLRSPAAQPPEKPSNRGCSARLSLTPPRGLALQSAGYSHASE